MHNLLRFLILLMVLGVCLTTAVALGWVTQLGFSHIHLAIVTFLYTIFAQAFVMFYFIGTSRLATNVYNILRSETSLNELFDEPPADLKPYVKKVYKFVLDTDRGKRQTIPWTMLMLVLGTIAFLLGGAHDTNLVEGTTHSGVAYGFIVAMFIGFFRQWYYLGMTNKTIRKLKTLFSIPDGSM